MLRQTFLTLLLLISSQHIYAQWINEIHYDNSSTDVNECIEVAGPAGTDLSCFSIVLYNGSTTYDTDNLSGIIPDEGCGYGAISLCYPSSGIQNGPADGIALVNCGGTVIQFLSYEGVITATNGPANGMTSTDIGVSEGGSTANSSLQLIGSGASYGDFSWQAEGISAPSFGSLNAGQSIAPCGGGGNTITEGSLTGGPFTVDCSGPTSDSGTFNFTSTGTFNSGNVFTAELTNGTVLGTLAADGVDPSGAITITIPSGLPSGTYDVQIVSDNPYAISGTVSITVTQSGACTPPHITSVIINSCNSVCQEGQNELVFGNTGDYSVLVNETNFNFSYTNSGPLNNYTDNLTNNSTTTQELNDICPDSDPFIDAYNTTIPPNASWVLANDALCATDALDWSGLCNSGPIYIIYSTDSDWSLSGNFSNSTSGTRPYQTSITTTSGETFTIDYETDGTQYANSDGVFATFDSDGGPATSYGDDDCMINPVVLPVELVDFAGQEQDSKNELYWTTASERNSSHFEVHVTQDGDNWESVGIVSAAGNSTDLLSYRLDHFDAKKAINYYRLSQFDLDGAFVRYTKLVTIDNREVDKHIVGRYNTLGQEINEEAKGVQILLYSDGSTKRIFNH